MQDFPSHINNSHDSIPLFLLNEHLPGPTPKTIANKIIRQRLQYGIQKYQSWGKNPIHYKLLSEIC